MTPPVPAWVDPVESTSREALLLLKVRNKYKVMEK
jgi:hypothetical protein